MPAGYSGTPLPRKLGIRDGARVATIGAPAHFRDLLEPLPDGVEIDAAEDRESRMEDQGAAGGDYDVVVAFMADRETLDGRIEEARWLLAIDGGLWVAWPKKSSALHRDLARERVREVGLEAGLVDNKVCAIDEDWSGLRFVYRVKDR